MMDAAAHLVVPGAAEAALPEDALTGYERGQNDRFICV